MIRLSIIDSWPTITFASSSLIFSFAPASLLDTLGFFETEGMMLRLYGIFPLSWAVLFFFALKDIGKNMAIIKGAIITSFLVPISIAVFHLFEGTTGWFHWLSSIVLIGYALLLIAFKPKNP